MLRLHKKIKSTINENNSALIPQLEQAKKIEALVKSNIENAGYKVTFNSDISDNQLKDVDGFKIFPHFSDTLSQIIFIAKANDEINFLVSGINAQGKELKFSFDSNKYFNINQLLGKDVKIQNISDDLENIPADGFIVDILEKFSSILFNLQVKIDIKTITQNIKNSIADIFKSNSTQISTTEIVQRIGQIIKEEFSKNLLSAAKNLLIKVTQNNLSLTIQLVSKQGPLITTYYSTRTENKSLYISQMDTPAAQVPVSSNFQSQKGVLKQIEQITEVSFDSLIKELPLIINAKLKSQHKLDDTAKNTQTSASVDKKQLQSILNKLPEDIVYKLGYNKNLFQHESVDQTCNKTSIFEAALSQIRIPNDTSAPTARMFNDALRHIPSGDLKSYQALMELFLYLKFNISNKSISGFQQLINRLTTPAYLNFGFNLNENYKLKVACIYLLLNNDLPLFFDDIIRDTDLKNVFIAYGGDAEKITKQKSSSNPNLSVTREQFQLLFSSKLAIFYMPSLYEIPGFQSIKNTIYLWYKVINDEFTVKNKNTRVKECFPQDHWQLLADTFNVSLQVIKEVTLSDLIKYTFYSSETDGFTQYDILKDRITVIFPQVLSHTKAQQNNKDIENSKLSSQYSSLSDFQLDIEHNGLHGSQLDALIKQYQLSFKKQVELGAVISEFFKNSLI